MSELPIPPDQEQEETKLPEDIVAESGEVKIHPLKLSAAGDVDEATYKVLFNRAVTDGDKFEFYLKAVKDQTNEELVDTIGLLSQLIVKIKVAQQSAKITLEDRKITLNAEQRELLRLRDQQYKPKKVEDPNKPKKVSAPRRKSGTAKVEDAAEMMSRVMGISVEAAKKMIDSLPNEE